jgi:hypothetical protein
VVTGDLLWLIGAWILLGRKPAPASSTSKPAPLPTAAPPRVAYLYQLPGDAYETVRVAVSSQANPVEDAIDQAHPIEMGIFSNEANALALVHSKGWALAWPGVKQLPDRP